MIVFNELFPEMEEKELLSHAFKACLFATLDTDFGCFWLR